MGKIVGLTFEESKQPNRFVCDICGAEFKTSKELKSHLEKEHSGKK